MEDWEGSNGKTYWGEYTWQKLPVLKKGVSHAREAEGESNFSLGLRTIG